MQPTSPAESNIKQTKKKRKEEPLVIPVHLLYDMSTFPFIDFSQGWISGLSEEEGKLHPTTGGLRIGKKMQERTPSDPFNEDLEWDRDGQYYHYLTKWMHALNCVSKSTGDMQYDVFASELAQGTHSHFTYGIGSGRKRMYWKMSIDLSRPLVPSMGHHDPLDG